MVIGRQLKWRYGASDGHGGGKCGSGAAVVLTVAIKASVVKAVAVTSAAVKAVAVRASV